jgi:NAD(P)-dependent dehydrogenase (short-subunit alcohol dehydrogenase family)
MSDRDPRVVVVVTGVGPGACRAVARRFAAHEDAQLIEGVPSNPLLR